jgi:hypothetical protein
MLEMQGELAEYLERRNKRLFRRNYLERGEIKCAFSGNNRTKAK